MPNNEDSLPQTENMEAIIAAMARAVVDRHMETPVLFLLELNRPFEFMTGQALLFAEPLAGACFGFRRIRLWRGILENRESVDRLIKLIEEQASLRSEKKHVGQMTS